MMEKPTAVIETAHRYTLKDTLDPEALRSEIALSEKIADVLRANRYSDAKMILHDDTFPRSQQDASVDSWRWSLFIERDIEAVRQEVPDEYTVVRENDFLAQGAAVIEELQAALAGNSDAPLPRLGGLDQHRVKVGTKKGINVSLTQKITTDTGSINEIPSCPVLDLAIYREKLRDASVAVTILPEWFKEQQNEVRTLFAILGELEPSVMVVYFDPEAHTVTDVSVWNQDLQQLASEVRSAVQQSPVV